MSTSGGTPAGTPTVVTRTVTAAQIATLHSVPVTLIAAPGAGKVLQIVQGSYLEFLTGVDGFADFPTPVLTYGAGGSKATWGVGETFPAAAPPTSTWMQLSGGDQATGSPQSYDRAAVANKAIILDCAPGNPNRAGPIVTAAIAAGGAGYAPLDTGTIDTDPSGYTGGATYRVDTVGAAGIVTALTITGAGNGYTTINNPAATTVGGGQPGVGAGLTVNVTAITPIDGSLVVTLAYLTVTLS